jgi:hypothetical protein
MDPIAGIVPAAMAGLIAATSSCVAMGTFCEVDGSTQISLSDEIPTTIDDPVFDGVLDTPSRRISIMNIRNESLVTTAVKDIQTRVRIWANHASEPDQITIVTS